MFGLALRSLEFVFYRCLLGVVDRVSRLPRDTQLPDAMRLYRENIALKAQLDALERAQANGPHARKRVPLSVRASQVFAYFLTRGNPTFQHYSLSASLPTILRWASRFRGGARASTGRPSTDQAIVDLVVRLKRENPGWGQRRIREELRRMGVRVSEPTIQKILREQGLAPRPGGGPRERFELVRASAKDAVWALDYFGVQTARGAWMQVLLVIDIYTRELIDLRVHDGLDVDSAWSATALNDALARTKRTPTKVVHDRGTHFKGQFSRQLRVLDIEESITPARSPVMNCFAESAIRGVRFELVNHIRARDADNLQRYLDEYRRYANTERSHQGLDGCTPDNRATSATETKVISLAQLRASKLERRSYAHGLLNGYSLAKAA